MSDEEKVDYDEGSMANDLAAAFDDATDEVEETVDEQVEHREEESSVEDISAAVPDDDQGVPEPAEEVQASEGDTPDVGDAPSSLPPAAREAWGDTPDAVKAAVAKREKDYEAGIMKYADNAKRAQQMDHVLQPYQQLLAMNGGPGKTISGLLQAASALQMGTPMQSAQTIANMINTFGVDIQTLDSLLSGQDVPRGTQQASEVQQAVNQAIQPYQQMFEQQRLAEQRAQQAQQAQVGTELQQFQASHEFYNDVAADMANVMDMAANRGENMTLDKAYDLACQLNPEISTIIRSRQGAQAVAQKQKAAVSISGTPGGPGGEAGPNTMTDSLNAAWDAVARR